MAIVEIIIILVVTILATAAGLALGGESPTSRKGQSPNRTNL